MFDSFYSEKSLRLPETFWCYDPLSPEPAVNELPALKSGRVTFGSLNNFCKVNGPLLKLWAGVLRQVPESRLMLLADEGSHRGRTLKTLAREGISSERVVFCARQPPAKYLELYHQIDIGLDTLPYNGHTTTLDAAWMGVPTVTLVGETVVGRAGFSQLTQLGLSELVASKADDFLRVAIDLANDLPRLAELRRTLRGRMRQSSLMDSARFAQGIEAAYRAMWRAWCHS
jgi:predicted O-linked N-acetylglucosamine transferase (SPINDLY family)